MAIDTSGPRSRRALLGAGLGAVAATALSAMTAAGRSARIDGPGVPVLLNATNEGTATTTIETSFPTAFSANSGNGVGVNGYSLDGVGVQAGSTDGVALSTACYSGIALQVFGRIDLDTAGVATIPSGATSKTVALTPVNVTAGSFVLLTPAADIGTRRLWFTKDAVLNTITVHMSSSRPSPTKVSWLLLG